MIGVVIKMNFYSNGAKYIWIRRKWTEMDMRDEKDLEKI